MQNTGMKMSYILGEMNLEIIMSMSPKVKKQINLTVIIE